MTTLFPQIKRVDEDETSKIIKNVLFNNQDGIKLEKIFDEFMHLTEELSYSDDDDVSDSDGSNSNSEEEEEEEEDEEDDDGDTSDDSEDTPPRGPTSWNLDHFINSQPQPQPQSPSPPLASPSHSLSPLRSQPKSPSPSPPPPPPPISHSRSQSLSHSKQPKLEAKQPVSKPEPKLASKSVPILEPKREPEPVPRLKLEPEPEPRISKSKHEPKLQQSQTAIHLQPQSQSHSQAHSQNHVNNNNIHNNNNNNNNNHHKHKQPSASCIVQIDLSKLKRIPTTKAPTPTMTGSKSIQTAKALKHEADVEKDKTKQAIKYLEACMYFILHGQELEKEGGNSHGTQYYYEVIPLFKHVRKLSASCNPDNSDNMTSLKINALTQKCLSILYTKLYKLRERELPELAKLTSSYQNGSPIQQADELLIGVKPSFLSAYKRQMTIFDYLKNAHDNWHNAEHLCDQHPALKIFFSTIESNCGSLTMITPFSKLMDHVQCGLKLLRTS